MLGYVDPQVRREGSFRKAGAALEGPVLVAGATGATGKLVVSLLAREQVPVVALVRDPASSSSKTLLSAAGAASGNVQLIQCRDASNPECVANAFREANSKAPLKSVICCLGKTGGSSAADGEAFVTAVKNLLRGAERSQGCQRFIYMSSGFVTRPSHPVAIMLNTIAGLILAYHAQAEDEVRMAAARAGGGANCLDYVICRPGGLDHGNPGDGIAVTQGDTLKGGSVRRSRVAEVLVQCLRSDRISRGAAVTFEVAGDKTQDSAECKAPGAKGDLVATNAPVADAEWGRLLGELKPDPDWETLTSPSKEGSHLKRHRRSLNICRAGCGICCLALIAAIVLPILASRAII